MKLGYQRVKSGTHTWYEPCSGIPQCCALNGTGPTNGDLANGDTISVYLPNGVCRNKVLESRVRRASHVRQIVDRRSSKADESQWVNFCTNNDITSSNCLNIGDETRSCGGNTAIVPCDGAATSDRWSCGDSNACCTSDVGVVRLEQVLGGTLSSSGSSVGATTSTVVLASLQAAMSSSRLPPQDGVRKNDVNAPILRTLLKGHLAID
jgi:hypothetical protein